LPALGSRLELLEQALALPGGELVARLAAADVHLVGGVVRDLLTGRRPRELDLVVERPLSELLQRLPGAKVIHGDFETATVLTPEGARVDLARSRRERYPRGGALPQVEPAGLEEDLWRRDFTVNALALTTGGPQRGMLHGLPSSLADLELRRLEVTHSRSFQDDPTRLLRLARYQARLGFQPGPTTLALARAAVALNRLATVSCTRIANELRRNLTDGNPLAQLEALKRLGIPRALRLAQPSGRTVAAGLAVLGERGDQTVLLALALVAGSPKAQGGLSFLHRAGLSRGEIAALRASLDRLEEARHLLSGRTELAPLHRRLRQMPAEGVAWAAAAAGGPALLHGAHYLRRRRARVAVGGRDLIAAGLPPGPAIGRALAALEELVVAGAVGEGAAEQLRKALELAKD